MYRFSSSVLVIGAATILTAKRNMPHSSAARWQRLDIPQSHAAAAE
jgi:hypothetical protein